eukprot:EG_transcript_17036
MCLFTASFVFTLLILPLSQTFEVPCEARPSASLCHNCNASYREHVLGTCHLNQQISVSAGLFQRTSVISVSQRGFLGRFGNLLGLYYSAMGLATLSGLELPPVTLDHDDIHLEFSQAAPSSFMEFQQLPALEAYCLKCPMNESPVYHECAGLWTVPNIRRHLQAYFRRHQPRGPRRPIVIQFRCGDSHNEKTMGLLDFDYYRRALQSHVDSSSRISILPDPYAAILPCCMALMQALQAALIHEFHCAVELMSPGTVGQDFATMMYARVLVASPSTFGLFAAIAVAGQAYLPAAPVLPRQLPCFDRVKWVRVRRHQDGCTKSVVEWFVNSTGLREYMEAVVHGPWAGGPPLP